MGRLARCLDIALLTRPSIRQLRNFSWITRQRIVNDSGKNSFRGEWTEQVFERGARSTRAVDGFFRKIAVNAENNEPMNLQQNRQGFAQKNVTNRISVDRISMVINSRVYVRTSVQVTKLNSFVEIWYWWAFYYI